jgi:hypothetical protein
MKNLILIFAIFGLFGEFSGFLKKKFKFFNNFSIIFKINLAIANGQFECKLIKIII